MKLGIKMASLEQMFYAQETCEEIIYYLVFSF